MKALAALFYKYIYPDTTQYIYIYNLICIYSLRYDITRINKKKIKTFRDIQVEDYGTQFSIICYKNEPQTRYKRSEFIAEENR